MAIDPTLTALPEDIDIDGSELVETLGRDGRKMVPVSKMGASPAAIIPLAQTQIEKNIGSLPAEAMASDPAITMAQRFADLTSGGGRGGRIVLPPNFESKLKTKLKVPSKCGFEGQGAQSSMISKHADFPADTPLLDFSGATDSGNSGGHAVEQDIWGVKLGGNGKTGRLVNADYVSGMSIRSLRMTGARGTAFSMKEAWDSSIDTISALDCGGPLGREDAVFSFTGSPVDKTNIIRIRHMHAESQPNCGLAVHEDGNGQTKAPFGIDIVGLKIESQYLVNGAKMIDISDYAAPGVKISGYLNLHAGSNVPASPATNIILASGLNYFDLLRYNLGDNITVQSVVRPAASSQGMKIGRIVGGKNASTPDPTCLVELKSNTEYFAADGVTPIGYQYGAGLSTIDQLVGLGSVPPVGGGGATSKVLRIGNLRGTLRQTLTGPRNIVGADVDRLLAVNNTTGADWGASLFNDNGAAPGERIKILQTNTNGLTITGVNPLRIIPKTVGGTVGTKGKDTMCVIECIDQNTWIEL